VNHPVVGTLRLNRYKLPTEEVILVLCYPDQGTDSAEKMRILASLTADPVVRPAVDAGTVSSSKPPPRPE
jgi:hypothetical protein